RWLGEFYKYLQVNSFRHNLDGLLLYEATSREEIGMCYIQFFRNGSIEIADSWLLQANEKTIPDQLLEKTLLGILPATLSMQQQLGLHSPMIVMLSLLHVNGYKISIGSLTPSWY